MICSRLCASIFSRANRHRASRVPAQVVFPSSRSLSRNCSFSAKHSVDVRGIHVQDPREFFLRANAIDQALQVCASNRLSPD
jgi:hypothetical protein